MQIMNILL